MHLKRTNITVKKAPSHNIVKKTDNFYKHNFYKYPSHRQSLTKYLEFSMKTVKTALPSPLPPKQCCSFSISKATYLPWLYERQWRNFAFINFYCYKYKRLLFFLVCTLLAKTKDFITAWRRLCNMKKTNIVMGGGGRKRGWFLYFLHTFL